MDSEVEDKDTVARMPFPFADNAAHKNCITRPVPRTKCHCADCAAGQEIVIFLASE